MNDDSLMAVCCAVGACESVCYAMQPVQMLEVPGFRQKLLEALSLGRRQQYCLPHTHEAADAHVPRGRRPSPPASFCRGEEEDSELLSFVTAFSIAPLSSSSSSSESESTSSGPLRRRERRPSSRHGVREPLIMGNQDGKLKRSEAGGATDESAAQDGTKKGSHGKKSRGEGGKKKNKPDRSSVFPHIRKRKSKAKGLLSGSKEDALDELDSVPSLCNKTPDLSGDELGHSDAEPERPRLAADSRQNTLDGPEEEEKKVVSSGSDTDMYSFHSAAEQEDLLADIQQAIRLKQGVILTTAVELPWERDCKQTSGDVKNTPTPDSEPFTVLEAIPKLENGLVSAPHLPEEEEAAVNGHSEEALCAPVAVETVTKEPEAPSPLPSPPPVVAATTSTTSFPDLTASFESAVEAVEEDDRTPPDVPSTDTVSDIDGLGSTGSLECLTVIEPPEEHAVTVQRRKSSVSFPQESPLATRLLKSAVKPYPPISTSYIKTTTRQLSSPSCSPVPSPSHSPLFTRRGRDARAERRRVKRQRSYSITGPISRSADWTEELRTLPPKAAGSADYLEYGGSEGTLRTGGAALTATQRASATQSSTCSFQEVFTGEFCTPSELL